MKRLVTLFLAFMLILSLSACSDDNSTDDKKHSKNKSDEISFTEIVAVDNDECMIKITEIDPDNESGFTLKAELENKSEDKAYLFSVYNAAINDVQCDVSFLKEVTAGNKSLEEIIFANDIFDENDIGDYTDIELAFQVYDSGDVNADDVANETVHIYPYGEDNAVKFVRESQDSDNVLIDNEYVTVIVTGYDHDDIWGYAVNLFLLNKCDKDVMFMVEEASVNGYMADPYYAYSVSVGKCAFSNVYWSDTEFEENGITDVEEIEFKLRAYNADDWTDDAFANETFTLNP